MKKNIGHGYSVDTEGNVYGKRTGAILKGAINSKGYRVVMLRQDGKTVGATVHRLVAQAFIPNPNNLPQVNHKDEDKGNNSVDNLEWCTNQYNMEYSRAKHYRLVNPDGELVHVYNLDKFCREMGLDSSGIRGVIRGATKQCKGWTNYVPLHEVTTTG